VFGLTPGHNDWPYHMLLISSQKKTSRLCAGLVF